MKKRWVYVIILVFLMTCLSGYAQPLQAMSEVDYELTVLDDEDVPLSSTLQHTNSNRIITIVVIVVALLAVVIGIYIIECCKYRECIKKLQSDLELEQVKLSWNIMSLRRMASELENKVVATIQIEK